MALKNVIEIPSSKIYKIENKKVIDNKLSRMELTTTVPSIVNDTENVYNGSVDIGFVPDDLQKGEIAAKATQHGVGTNTYYPTAIAYIEETPTYVTATFTIPRLSIQNSSILKILTGEASNGEPNIKCSFIGSVSNGTSNGSAYIFNASPLGVDVRNLVVEAPTDVLTTLDQSYSLSTEVTDISYTSTFGEGSSSVTTTATFALSNASTILSADATPTDDGESFIITLKILCGIEINKLKGGLNFPNTPVNLRLKGEYIKYEPKEVNVSFYGNVIKLKVDDNNIILGDDKFVQEFQGNELIQLNGGNANVQVLNQVLYTSPLGQPIYKMIVNSGELQHLDTLFYKGDTAQVIIRADLIGEGNIGVTVYPKNDLSEIEDNKIIQMKGKSSFNLLYTTISNQLKIFENYQKVIDNWENGKETAVITCAIDDYKAITEEPISFEVTILSINRTSGGRTVYIGTEKSIEIGQVLILSNNQKMTVTSTNANGYNCYATTTTVFPFKENEIALVTLEGKFSKIRNIYISTQSDTDFKRTFKIGDIVIPYVFGYTGEDKPMSIYQDGSPKIFEVVGLKITYDGEITQRISLTQTDKKLVT